MCHSYDDQFILPKLGEQLSLNLGDYANAGNSKGAYFSAPTVDIDDYDRIILCMSGGKDSIASMLHLMDLKVDLNKVELWHHDIDGREGSSLMDWRFMADYNRKLAAFFGIPLYFSWLVGGFEGEMLKNESYSHPHKVETPDGTITLERDHSRAKPSTRLRFPQVSANLQTRWCSSALKIDVGRRALNNQSRFNGQKILFITGERREESSNRARYNQLERHACDRRLGRTSRHVDAWRPVLHWSEERVWDALQRHGVTAPVPYRLGWNRSSCMACIFNDAKIWATILHVFPEKVQEIAEYEKQFGTTISRQKQTVLELAQTAVPFEVGDIEALGQAMNHEYTLPIIQNDNWSAPAGAYTRIGCGPS